MAQWRTIPGWDAYEISIKGIVRRCKVDSKGRGSNATYIGKICKPRPRGKYIAVTIHQHGKRKDFSIHVLMLLVFKGPRPTPRHHGAHKNGKHHENRLRNLYWATPQQNQADSIRHGTKARGERAGHRKFTAQKVRGVRTKYRMGISQEKLAQLYITSQSYIGRIVRREVWAHIP